MFAPFLPIIAALVFMLFLALMFFSKEDKNRLFIKYVLLAFPLISTRILPGDLGINNFLLMVAVFVALFYKRRVNTLVNGEKYRILFITILIIGLAGSYAAESLKIDTVRTFIEIIATFAFAKIVIDEIIEDPPFFYNIIGWIKITLIVSLAFLVCQFIFGLEFSISQSQNGNVAMEDGITRYAGMFQDPQKFAQFLAVCSFFFLIKHPEEEKLPTTNYIFIVLCLVAIMYTGGRAALGGWALGFFLIVIFGNTTLKIYSALLAIALFVVVYNFSDKFAVFNRGDNLQDSYDFRFGIWKEAFQIFLDNRYFGIAPGNYANYVSVHYPNQFWFINNDFQYYDHPESGYLKWLPEYGAVGFLSILLLIIIPMVRGLFAYLRSRDTTYLLLIASLISWIVGFYTVYSFGDTRIIVLITTTICLLMTAYTRFDEEEIEEEELQEEQYAEN